MRGWWVAALLCALTAQPSYAAPKPEPWCFGVVVDTPNGKSNFTLFGVHGSQESLQKIREAALAINAKPSEIKVVEGQPYLTVIFTSFMRAADAVSLFKRVEAGEFHPPGDKVDFNTFITPLDDTRRKCPIK